MKIGQTLFAFITMALCVPLCAQGLSFSELYGADYTARNDGRGGVLSSSLKVQAPEWLDFSGSGTGLITERFRFHDGGMVITPDKDHGSCEARLDIGISAGTLRVNFIELDIGGACGWLLRDLSDASRAWLVEVRRESLVKAELRVRVLNRGVFRLLPDAGRAIENLELPAALEVTFSATKLTANIAGAETEIALEGANGVGVGLVATDQRARLRDLFIDFMPHETWAGDATMRQLARRALQHLREHATNGMLAGVAAHPHPLLEAALGRYNDAEINSREIAVGRAPRQRAEIMIKLADTHGTLAAAQHEAGLAALQAGDVDLGVSYLLAADKLFPAAVTSVALAEAYRRQGHWPAALKELARKHENEPAGLGADRALISARAAADDGFFDEAIETLAAALDQQPDHAGLATLADSMDALMNPQTLRASSLAGPLGLTLLTDVPDAQLKPILDRLTPYLELIRRWLPHLPKELPGNVAVFNSPVEYLRVALAVAGDKLDNVAGMYVRRGLGTIPTVFACRAFGEDELLRTLVHEIWHRAVDASAGRGGKLPEQWLNEGMAVYLSAGRMEGGVMVFDRLPAEFGDGAPHHELTIDCLKHALSNQREFYNARHVYRNYLAAWAIARYLAEHGSFEVLGGLLKGDADIVAAFEADLDDFLPRVLAAVKKLK